MTVAQTNIATVIPLGRDHPLVPGTGSYCFVPQGDKTVVPLLRDDLVPGNGGFHH